MDAVTLDQLLRETLPRVHGRVVRRVRAAGPEAIVLELERVSLWLDVGRATAGLYALDRAALGRLRALTDGWPADPRGRQAVLHLRKHAAPRRLAALRRIEGERVVVIDLPPATLVLRLARPAALTLAVDGAPLAVLGGDATWPPPPPAPERGWRALTVEQVRDAAAHERSVAALLARCPELGPALARRVAASPASWPALREALERPSPALVLPDDPSDAALAAGPVELLPTGTGEAVDDERPWSHAAARYLEAVWRGARFERRRRPLQDAARAAVRRLAQLERHLAQDREGLPEEAALRRQAEALLAFGREVATGATDAELPDPYDASARVAVRLDPRLSGPANADRLFDKARRVARARTQIEERLARTRAALDDARAQERRLSEARFADELPAADEPEAAPAATGLRRYLTSRGLVIVVGRGGRENHEVTFKVAGPEDYWLHARDAPGAHVVLRDPEGRAGPDDLREAAEVAAFFSRERAQTQVDVHATRRKHVQPTGGAPGRVRVLHSDTLRVAPRDPDGRLRAR